MHGLIGRKFVCAFERIVVVVGLHFVRVGVVEGVVAAFAHDEEIEEEGEECRGDEEAAEGDACDGADGEGGWRWSEVD